MNILDANYVRPFRPSDLPLLARLQSAQMRAEFAAAFTALDLDDELLRLQLEAQSDPDDIATSWQSQLDNWPAHNSLYVADNKEKPGFYGFAALAVVNERAEITCLYVDSQAQNQGHASRLLTACAGAAKAENCSFLTTWIMQTSSARQQFFASSGFAPLGSRSEIVLGDKSLQLHCWGATL